MSASPRTRRALLPTPTGDGLSRGQRIAAMLGLAILLAFLAMWPYLGAGRYYVGLTASIMIAAMTATSINFLVGQAGLASLGNGAIAGAAGYAIAWAYAHGYGAVAGVLLAIGLTIVVSLIYGVVTMRTSGIYFLMVTLALGMLIYGLAFRWSAITGGDNGLRLRRPEWINNTDNWWVFYYLVLVVFVLSTAVLWFITRSPFGSGLRGIRESESRMRSLGYSVAAYKVVAFLISGLVAGLGGILGAWNTQLQSPHAVNVEVSILAILMVILGGVGTLIGPLVGATIVILVQTTVSSYVSRWQTLLGLVFIAVVLFARAGLVGSIANLLRRRPRGAPSVPPGEALAAAGSPSGKSTD
jgi:branched-chain amino acid transport system permease protein